MRMTIKIVSAYGRPFDGPSAAFDESGGTIGRRADCTLVVPDKRRHVSRIHALIVRTPDGFLLHDQGSYLPVRVNGMRVGYGQHVPVCEGDTIQIGPFGMRVEEMETAWDLGVRPPADEPLSGVRTGPPVRREDVAQSFVITDLGVEGATPVDFVLDDGATSGASVGLMSGGHDVYGSGSHAEGRAVPVDTSTFDLLAQRLGTGSDAYQPFLPAVWEEEAGGMRPVPVLRSPPGLPPVEQTRGHDEVEAVGGRDDASAEGVTDGPEPAGRIRHLLAAVGADIDLVRPAVDMPTAAEEGSGGLTEALAPEAAVAEPIYAPGEPPLLMPEPRHAVPLSDRADLTEPEDFDGIALRRRLRKEEPLSLQSVLSLPDESAAGARTSAVSDHPEIVLVLERVSMDPSVSGAGEFLVPIRRRNRRTASRSSARR